MKRSLSENLRRSLGDHESTSVSLQTIVDNVEEQGFGLLLMFYLFRAPYLFLQRGIRHRSGFFFIALGLQMLAGRHRPWLPNGPPRRSSQGISRKKRLGEPLAG